jgi:threonine/homoserine/homoserine lactone efflux protein
MFDIQNVALFMTASILLNVIPGPDAIYIVSRSIAYGRRTGVLSSLGICTGALVHTIAAALGLSAILATSATAFTVIKVIGAGYLIFLGIKTFFDRSNVLALDQPTERSVSAWTIFRQGILVDVLNPKVAIFFLAFLPQFIAPSSDAKAATFIFLGLIVIGISLVWEFFLVMASVAITHYIRRSATIGKQMNRAVGLVYAGLGVRLAMEKL